MQSSFSVTTPYSQTITLPHTISRKYRYLMFWNDHCSTEDVTILRELCKKEFIMYLVVGITPYVAAVPYPARIRGIILVPSEFTLPFIIDHMPINTTLFPFSITGSADVALDCITSMDIVFSGGQYHEDSIAINMLHTLDLLVKEKTNDEYINDLCSDSHSETDVDTEKE